MFEEPEVEGPTPIEKEYARRKSLKPGKKLLKLSLEDPRKFTSIGKNDDFVALALKALGAKGPAAATTSRSVLCGPSVATITPAIVWPARSWAAASRAAARSVRLRDRSSRAAWLAAAAGARAISTTDCASGTSRGVEENR